MQSLLLKLHSIPCDIQHLRDKMRRAQLSRRSQIIPESSPTRQAFRGHQQYLPAEA